MRSPRSSEGGTEGPRVFPKDHIRVGCLHKKSIGTSGVCWDQVEIEKVGNKHAESAGARKLDMMSRVDLLRLISCVYNVSEDSDVNGGHADIRQAKRF